MPEAAVNETAAAVVKALTPPPRGARADAQVITSDNFEAYVETQLNPGAAEPEPTAAPVEEPATTATPAETAEPAEEVDHPDEGKKGKLQERFSELTQRRKDAEAKAESETKARREAQERAEALQRERDDLKAKYEPPKPDELGPEPQPSQFADATEYGKALKDWTADATRREDARKQEEAQQVERRAASVKNWNERQAVFEKSNKALVEKHADTLIPLSDQISEEIRDSEVGPEIFFHLAENVDLAKEIRAMPLGKALKAFGRLEAQFLKGAKAEPKPAAAAQPRAEISKAPPPITPLGTAGAPVTTLAGSNEWHGTYEEFRAKRKSGQIR